MELPFRGEILERIGEKTTQSIPHLVSRVCLGVLGSKVPFVSRHATALKCLRCWMTMCQPWQNPSCLTTAGMATAGWQTGFEFFS